MRRILSVSLILVALLAGLSFWWIRSELLTPYYGAGEPETFIEIPKGAGTNTIAKLLAEHQIIRHSLPFLFCLHWTNSTRKLQAGEYRFASPESPIQIVARLVQGDVYFRTITIPEGLDSREVIERLISFGLGRREDFERFLFRTDWIHDIAPQARSLEGFLFPDTYRFRRRATSDEILKIMVDQFRSNAMKLLTEHPIPEGWSLTEIVTLASLIEKEAQAPEERPVIASVLVNRLERGVPLACDPTIIFALKLADDYDGHLHKADMSIKSPYNTYLHRGLPPSPIANPGIASLSAALVPAKSNFLYYVSRNDGTHQFSKDYRAHLAAVAKYQKPLSRRRPPLQRPKA